MELKYEDLKQRASLQGIDLDKEVKKKKGNYQKGNKVAPLFGDPEEYAHMTDKEKEELTQKMMEKYGKHFKGSLEVKKDG